jgi:hypothetical protein
MNHVRKHRLSFAVEPILYIALGVTFAIEGTSALKELSDTHETTRANFRNDRKFYNTAASTAAVSDAAVVTNSIGQIAKGTTVGELKQWGIGRILGMALGLQEPESITTAQEAVTKLKESTAGPGTGPFIFVSFSGGLGNAMFQYASALGIAAQYKGANPATVCLIDYAVGLHPGDYPAFQVMYPGMLWMTVHDQGYMPTLAQKLTIINNSSGTCVEFLQQEHHLSFPCRASRLGVPGYLVQHVRSGSPPSKIAHITLAQT